MNLFSRRNLILGAVIIVVSMLSAAIGSLVVGSSLDTYVESLESAITGIPSINSVKPRVLPGTVQEALVNIRENVSGSSLSIVNIKDRTHRDGVVTSKAVAHATALTTDGWLLVPKDVINRYGSNVRIILDGEVYAIDKFVLDPKTEYGFAKTSITSASVGTFGASDLVEEGDLVFIISGSEVYPRVIVNSEFYESETADMSSDDLDRLYKIDQLVDVQSGAMVTNSAGELVGMMVSENLIRPLHHITPALETVLLDGRVDRASMGVSVTDVSRVAEGRGGFREGWRVVSIDRRGAAFDSDLLVGDVIVRVQGQVVGSKPISEYVAEGKSGGRMQLQVIREETEIEIFVTLE